MTEPTVRTPEPIVRLPGESMTAAIIRARGGEKVLSPLDEAAIRLAEHISVDSILADMRTALSEVHALNEHLLGNLANLHTALRKWQATYPDLSDAHDNHPRGRFYENCPGCQAELDLLNIAEGLQP